MIRLWSVFLMVLLVAPAVAQDVPAPKDKDKPFMTLFTHANWQSIPQEAQLMRELKAEPVSLVVGRSQFNHYTTDSGLFKAGRWVGVEEKDFPILMMQKSNGQIFFIASKKDMPKTSQEIFDACKKGYEISKSLESQNSVAIEGPVFDRMPWLRDKDGNVDEVEGSIGWIFGGDTPIRDTFAWAGWIVVGFVLLGMIIVFLFVAAVFGLPIMFLAYKIVDKMFNK